MPVNSKMVPWLVFRLDRRMKRQLETLAEMGERSQGWIVRQALLGFLRDLEQGTITLGDVPELSVLMPGRRMTLQINVPATMVIRMQRLNMRTDAKPAHIIRAAVRRYMGKRMHILRGEVEARDDLRERGPDLPP